MNTEELYISFLNSDGQRCPFCDSEDTDYGEPRMDGRLNVLVWHYCHRCKSDWTVDYRIETVTLPHMSRTAKRMRYMLDE
jgi:transposase-like protein